MANLDSKPGKALRFDDFGSGPYTLYGHNLFVKREWDCKTLQTVSVEDVMGARIDREEIHTLSFGKGIREVEPGVIEFADLGVYIDQPMKSYSSGMKARLGFAFAVSIDPEILVVDEALSVGDKAFQKKCIARIREIMMDENVTVLFVTHSSNTAKEFCSRGIVLKKGQCVFDGPIDEAIAFYDKSV